MPFAVSTFGTLGHKAEGSVAMLASYLGSLQLISVDEPDLPRQFKERIWENSFFGFLSSIAYVSVIIMKSFWVVILCLVWTDVLLARVI